MLVICQQGGEAKLRALGLPPNIHVEHYNNIAGLDRYKDVRLLILAGRILPEPDKLETLAGALTGVEPKRANVNPKTGGQWYDAVERGIRTRPSRPCAGSSAKPSLFRRWVVCVASTEQPRTLFRSTSSRMSLCP